jgi:hypothetical protein
VPTRALVDDLVAIAAHGADGELVPGTIRRDEVVDLSLQFLLEQMPHTSKVARPLFADVTDEVDRSGGLDVRCLKGARDREDDGQPAAIVADAR